jgi:hypothetical protein
VLLVAGIGVFLAVNRGANAAQGPQGRPATAVAHQG